MELSTRDRQILQIMLDSGEPIQSQEIAKRLGISTRTVQRSLPYLEEAVRKYGMLLIRNRGEGNYLSGTPTSRERLSRSLPTGEGVDPQDRQERQKYLLFSLLKEREPRKIFYYSDLMGVSETTIAGDIEALSPWLKQNNLDVVKKKGFGVYLRGKEQDYREAMRRFIEENINQGEKSADKYNEAAFSHALMSAADTGIYSFLDKDVIQRVNEVLQGLGEPRLAELAENAYAGLMTHIAIAIERIRQGGFLKVPREQLEGLEEWEDYDLAMRILTEMEEEFEIVIPREEVSYILLHIQGSKLAYSADVAYKEAGGLEEEELLDIIDRMVDTYNSMLSPQLKSDEDFIRGLLVHLRPVFVRLRGHMNIYNPMLADIQKEYPDIFERCRKASQEIEKAIGIPVSDEEIGFLAMHFGAAEERLLKQNKALRKVTIGIVCASGFGVARLMMTRLEKYLSDQAYLKAMGRDEIEGLSRRQEVDFFVSTMNLDAYGVDYLLVSPLITGSDLSAIQYKMKDYSHLPKERGEEDFLVRIKRMEFFAAQIHSLLSHYRAFAVAESVSFRELLLFLGLKVTGNTKKANEIVTAVTEREKLYTQIFPELGFGLLHCRTGAVSEAVFVSCSPKEGGHFTNPYFKSIRAVVMMLAPIDDRRSEHAEVLGSISAAFVNNEGFLEALLNGREEKIRYELMRELKKFYLEQVQKLSG